MVHSNSGPGSGGGAGYDPNPAANTGKFIVKLDTGSGSPTIIQFPIQEANRHQIQIVWVQGAVSPSASQEELQTALNDELERQRQELITRGTQLGQQGGGSSAV
jgi:hypothetical protein